jgi:hypothetical protein
MEISQWTSLYSYLKLTKTLFFFSKNGEQEGKTGPVWGVGTVGAGSVQESMKESEYGENNLCNCMNMEKWDL